MSAVDAVSTSPAISVRGLWKVFGPKADQVVGTPYANLSRDDLLKETGCTAAVRDVTFDVAEGEVFVVMGLSGSGKSTLVRCLTRLIDSTAGEVLIEGEDILKASPSQLRHLRRTEFSMVFQHFGLLPHRKVIDNIAYPLEIQGVKKDVRYARAEEVIQLVGLQGYGNAYPEQLSGGMQQRVGLARAFATEAPLLLMDEPFSALDPLIRSRLQDELRLLQQRARKTLLFVSHDLDEALRIGDRIAIMDAGHIVQTGTPQDIVLRPATARVAEFVQHMNPLTALTAAMVMRPLAELPRTDGRYVLDDAGLYRLQLDDGTSVAHVTRGEQTLQLEQVETGLALRSVVRVRQSSGHPLLVSEAGRVVGVCDGADILRALGQTDAR